MKEKEKYEIIKKWYEGNLNFKAAQRRLGYTEQHMYRLKKLYKEKGKDGFIHGNRDCKPKTTIDQSLSNNIVLYYWTEYQEFNFKHYKIMLLEEKNIDVSYTNTIIIPLVILFVTFNSLIHLYKYIRFYHY